MNNDKLIEAMARAIAGAPFQITDTEWEQVRADESEYLMRITEAKMALAAAASAGYRLVPREPTDAMVDAVLELESDANMRGETAAFPDIWNTMLAAAPEVGRD